MSSVRIVLVNTTHPGNIGAAARAMKNMGLQHLYLVNPRLFPHAEASARAAGADDILDNAIITPDLATALQGCQSVFATSVRERALQWPTLSPKQAAQQIGDMGSSHATAIVFGREHAGLTNEELDLCQYQIQIPSVADFSSLNLAAAVQVICYELLITASAPTANAFAAFNPEWITQEELEGLFLHWEQVLIQTEFLNPESPGQVMRRLRRLFARTRIEKSELKVLRGILSQTQQALRAKVVDHE